MLPRPPPGNEHEQESKLMFSAGDRIGQFRVVREIGQGGMGCVYEVVADENATRLALKKKRSGSDKTERNVGATSGLAELGVAGSRGR